MARTRMGHQFIRPQVRNHGGMSIYRVDPNLHRMQWNENPFDFPADLKEEVLQRLARIPWSRYPLGIRAFDTIDAVAKYMEVGSDQVIVGNGSSDILRVVIASVLHPGDHVVTVTPTFGAYASHALHIGAEVHTVTLDPAQDFALPLESIIERAAQHQAKLVVICAPNNPTGTPYPLDQLRRIVTQVDALVLLDGAYTEFSDQDLRPLLAESDNVVLAHTLSKAFALAGVRVGYALSSPAVAAEMQKLVTSFTLSPFSESAAIIALKNRQRFQPLIDAIVAERERLAAALAQLPGVTVYSSATNFLFVYLGHSGKDAQHYLRSQEQLLIADMGMYEGYEKYVRISVGTPQQNDLVVNGLAHYLATVAV